MELENLASVKPAPDYEYFFNVSIPSCRLRHNSLNSFNQKLMAR